MLPEYEVYALRCTTREARRSDHFMGGDPHDGPMPELEGIAVRLDAEPIAPALTFGT